MAIHLRQICLIAEKLAPVQEDLTAVFSIKPAFHDDGVAPNEMGWLVQKAPPEESPPWPRGASPPNLRRGKSKIIESSRPAPGD